MRKSLLISIQPNHVINILREKKTLEIRKTIPKEWANHLNFGEPKPEPMYVYIYCTKKEPEMAVDGMPMNGKIVARFVLRKIDAYINGARWSEEGHIGKHDDYKKDCVCARAKIKEDWLWDYCNDLAFYALHIEDIELLERPIDLSEWNIKRPPQSWRYIWEG